LTRGCILLFSPPGRFFLAFVPYHHSPCYSQAELTWPALTMTLEQKKNKLAAILKDMESVLIAFSGGVDSTLVLAMARSVLGKEKTLAVTAQSESLPQRELEDTQKLAGKLDVEHLIIATEEMASHEYRKNPVNRCYHCKSELYTKLSAIASKRHLAHIVNGINRDDLGDFRPGIAAAKDFGVASPLAEAGFTKQDIRELSHELGLSTWEKPAMACLSSRVPYGQAISPEKLAMIEQAEDLLYSLGFTELRVRHHGDIARIELKKDELPKIILKPVSDLVLKRFKEIGFSFVTVDLEGFRSGSLNEGLTEAAKETSGHV